MQYDKVITNLRWRTDAILKIVFGHFRFLRDKKVQFSQIQDGGRPPFSKWHYLHISAVNSRFRSNLVRRCIFQFPGWTFNEKSKFCKFKMADAMLKIVFGYISAPYRPINAKFGSEMKNHTPIQDA